MKKKQSREKIAAVKEKDLVLVFGADSHIWMVDPTDPPPPTPGG